MTLRESLITIVAAIIGVFSWRAYTKSRNRP